MDFEVGEDTNYQSLASTEMYTDAELWKGRQYLVSPPTNIGTSIQVSPLFESWLCALFLQKTYNSTYMYYLHEFLLTERNPKKIFTFTKIGKERKQWSAFVLKHNVFREQVEWRRQAPSVGNTLRFSASSHHIFYWICEHASINKMCPKIIAVSLYTIILFD